MFPSAQLDWNDLLERQSAGESTVGTMDLVLDLSMLLHLFNKIFVLRRAK